MKNKHPLTLIVFVLGIAVITLTVGFLAQKLDPLTVTQDKKLESENAVSFNADNTSSQELSADEIEELSLQVNDLIKQGNDAAKQKKWNEAIEAFRQAFQKDPKNRDVVFGLGRLLVMVGEDEEAKAQFEKALSYSTTTPEKVEVHNFYGLFLKKRNKPDNAITQFETLLNLQPNNGYAAFQLGDLHRSNGRFETALSYYTKALEMMPGHGPSRMGRSFTLIRLHRYAEASVRLQEDIRVFPQENTFYHALARLSAAAPLQSVRNGRQALSIVEKLLEQTHLYPQLAETLAMTLAELGDFQRAEKIQAQAIARAGLDFPQSLLDQMEQQRKAYAAKKPCRQPWWDDDPIFYRNSYEPEKVTEHNESDLSWKAAKLSMPTRLRQIADQVDVSQMIYLNTNRAAKLQEQLDANRDLNAFMTLQPQYAKELLRAGQSLESRQALEKVDAVLAANNLKLEGSQLLDHMHRLALANFRMGEQENCQAGHNADSCILPIQGNGFHQIQRGSQGAIEIYKKILDIDPDNLVAKWLLNISYMTLGQYPLEVAPEHLINPATFSSSKAFPKFRDWAPDLGLDFHSLAGGIIADDFDNDGLLDLFISEWGLTDQVKLYRNKGDGHFEDITQKAGLVGITSGLNIMQTDYNNDGFLDVFMLRGAWMGEAGQHPNSLLRNNGDLTFTDVTEEAGLLSFRPTQTATWLDYNNDGFLDVFIGNESGRAVFPSELYQNMGNGTFKEVAAKAGIADIGHTKAVAAGDYDGDGRIDLFLSRYGEVNKLYRNLGPQEGKDQSIWQFEDVTTKAGVGSPLKSFPAWFFDYDNDGFLDLFISDYSNTGLRGVVADFLNIEMESEKARLYRNRGDGTFENVTQAMGLSHPYITMGSNFGDLDNDGFLDFYLGTGTPMMNMVVPNRMMQNQAGKGFVDITFSGGFGHLQKGHGISFCDLDNDGDQDVYAVMGGAFQGDHFPNAFFLNPGFNQDWIKVRLNGVTSNRFGVGATIAVTVRNGQNEPRVIYKTVGSGGSFGANPLRQEIGLGQDAQIEKLEVTWPVSGQKQVFTQLRANRFYLLSEDKAQAQIQTLPKFEFRALGGDDHEHH